MLVELRGYPEAVTAHDKIDVPLAAPATALSVAYAVADSFDSPRLRRTLFRADGSLRTGTRVIDADGVFVAPGQLVTGQTSTLMAVLPCDG